MGARDAAKGQKADLEMLSGTISVVVDTEAARGVKWPPGKRDPRKAAWQP